MEGNSKIPNGGWGWVVTFAAFMVSAILDGISFSFGILFKDLLQYFNEGKSLTSWIISVYNGATLGIGPVASILMSRFGLQKVAMFGGFLAAVSMFLSTFSPNVQVMILLYGVLGGSGLCLIYLPSFVLITQYFSSKRGIAVGMAFCGSGVGGFVFPPLMEFLITTYAWKGAMWIVSAIVLNCVAFGAMLRPLALSKRCNENNNKQELINKTKSPPPCRCCFLSAFDVNILKNPTLLLYGISCFLCCIGLFIPFTFLPDLADSFGMTSKQGAILIAIIGIPNTLGRVVAGWLADRPWADPIKINSFALITGGIASLFVTQYNTFTTMSVYCGLFGLTVAIFVTYQPIIALQLAGTEKMSSFFSVVCLVQGISAIVGAPFAGMLADFTGNYEGTFYLAGTSIALAGILCLPLKCLKRLETKRAIFKKDTSKEWVKNTNILESIYI